MIRINQIKIPVHEWENMKPNTEDYRLREHMLLEKKISKLLGIDKKQILSAAIVKKSIDARKKNDIRYIYSVDISISLPEERILKKLKNTGIARIDLAAPVKAAPTGSISLQTPPVVVGTGPAGLFCALKLAESGFCPIVLERGMDVDSRVREVEQFWQTGQLNTECNVQFGEGGAGTFSDGKLNTMVKDISGRSRMVLKTFAAHGAPEEILYLNKPHIGTDMLRGIVKNMREHIISLGGRVIFQSKLTDILITDGHITKIYINGTEELPCEVLVLAPGHSARDTFGMLHEKGMKMSPKSFAIGLRIEHPQELISRSQYGDAYSLLPPADYKLTHQTADGRGVYSFCMCPGGFVVNSSSEKGRMVVNGMSNYGREGQNANSALIVTVNPEDFDSRYGPLAGVEFQRKWEEAAYRAGQGCVPVQLSGDFINNRYPGSLGTVVPSIKGSFQTADLRQCLPEYVCKAIAEGILAFDKKLHGFGMPDAVLEGVETRTSSPVRLERDQGLEGSIRGIYPCGEGAGYAGGITSAAMDGIRVYEAIIEKYMA